MPQSNLNSADYYAILGCSKNANDAALKKAYRKLAVKWHPDKNPDNEQATTNFQKISEAYATLADPQKRQLYDQYGKQGADAADHMPNGAGAGGFGFGGAGGFPGPGGHFQGGTMSPEDAQKIFSEVFGSSNPLGDLGGGGGGMFQMGGIPGSMHGGSMNGMPGASFSSGSGMGAMPGLSSMFGGGGGSVDPISAMLGGMGGMSGMGGMGGMGGIPAGFASSSFQHQSQPQQQQYDIIPRGTVVSLQGLINASDRNGEKGIIQEYNSQTGRYVINLVEEEDSSAEEKDKKTMSVKASNIVQHAQVQIHDIQNQIELNGTTGKIVTWISSKERYNIYIASLKKFVSLKPGNIVLANGTVARIHGLQSKPELNGSFGTIKEWTRETNKYDVQLSPQQVVRVKAENIRV